MIATDLDFAASQFGKQNLGLGIRWGRGTKECFT